MKIKLFYQCPGDKKKEYQKELICDTSLVYMAPEKRFKFEFACRVSCIADNNDIPRDLVLKAQLIDDDDNIIYERQGLPLNVKYKSYVIDIYFPENFEDMEYYHKDSEVCVFYWNGKLYLNKNTTQWEEIDAHDKSEIIKKIEFTLQTKSYQIKTKDNKVYYYPTNSCTTNNRNPPARRKI